MVDLDYDLPIGVGVVFYPIICPLILEFWLILVDGVQTCRMQATKMNQSEAPFLLGILLGWVALPDRVERTHLGPLVLQTDRMNTWAHLGIFFEQTAGSQFSSL